MLGWSPGAYAGHTRRDRAAPRSMSTEEGAPVSRKPAQGGGRGNLLDHVNMHANLARSNTQALAGWSSS